MLKSQENGGFIIKNNQQSNQENLLIKINNKNGKEESLESMELIAKGSFNLIYSKWIKKNLYCRLYSCHKNEPSQFQFKKIKLEKQKSNISQSRIDNYFKTKGRLYELGDGKISSPEIRIAFWNVNGLRPKIKRGELLSYIYRNKADIICIGETKLSEDDTRTDKDISKIHSDYFGYFNCSKLKLGYSGVAIYSKFKPLSVKVDLGKLEHDNEGRVITLEYNNFFLVCCYIPNSGDDLRRLSYRTKEWDPSFRVYLKSLKDKKTTIVAGDFNVIHQDIDTSNPQGKIGAGITKEERENFSKLLEDGWVDTFRYLHPVEKKFSYYSNHLENRANNKGCRVDYIIISNDGIDQVIEADMFLDIVGSDHCPIEIKFKLNKTS